MHRYGPTVFMGQLRQLCELVWAQFIHEAAKAVMCIGMGILLS